MPLKPIKIKSRIESLVQDIKQADYEFGAYDAYMLAQRLVPLFKNNKKAKKYITDLENVIKEDPQVAFVYATNILKQPWPEAEPYIMKEPIEAYRYAKEILKRRWPEAEPIIKQDRESYNYYKKHFNIK